MAGTLAISVSPPVPHTLHSRSVTEPRQKLGRMWLKGREGEGAVAAQASAPETLKQGGFSSLLLSAWAAHSGSYGTCQNYPLLTPRGFLSGTPFLLHLRWDSVGRASFPVLITHYQLQSCR